MEVIMEKVSVSNESTQTIHTKNIDKEWLNLILEAKQLGISKEEVRKFLVCK